MNSVNQNNSINAVVDQAAEVKTDESSHTRLGWWIVLAGVGGFLLWASLAPLDKGVPLSGSVMVATNRKAVQHQTGGIVDSILVKEGDVVKAGQVLVKMNDIQVKAQAEITRGQLIATRAIEARLIAERDKKSEIDFPAFLLTALDDPRATGSISLQKQLFHSRQSALKHELAAKMPEDAPRYLMGVGTPEDLVEAVNAGVDMFDCVIPTRNGRTGSAFTSHGKLNIRNAKFATDDRPLDPECSCSVCRRYSLGYLRHLYQVGEMNASIMISHHNVAFFIETMRRTREAIRAGEFQSFRKEFLDKLTANATDSV